MNDYEKRKQERIERYEARAEQARAESAFLSHQASSMLSAIPPGQPMMPDHHSYKSDVAYRKRIDQKFHRSIDAGEKAEYYEQKARAARNNTVISADDPEALEKLKAKLGRLKESQKYMKRVNAYYQLLMGDCAVFFLRTLQQQSGNTPN